MKWIIDMREQAFPPAFEEWLTHHPQNAKQIDVDFETLDVGDLYIEEAFHPLIIENKIGADIHDIPRMLDELRRMAAHQAYKKNQARGRSVSVPQLHFCCCDTPRCEIDRHYLKVAMGACQKFNIWFHHALSLPKMISQIWRFSRSELEPLNVAQNLVYKPDRAETVGYALATMVDGLSPKAAYKLCEGLQTMTDVTGAFPNLRTIKRRLDLIRGQDTDLLACKVLRAIDRDKWLEECAIVCKVCGRIIESESFKRHHFRGWQCNDCYRRVV